jgi:hypothetical protein
MTLPIPLLFLHGVLVESRTELAVRWRYFGFYLGCKVQVVNIGVGAAINIAYFPSKLI